MLLQGSLHKSRHRSCGRGISQIAKRRSDKKPPPPKKSQTRIRRRLFPTRWARRGRTSGRWVPTDVRRRSSRVRGHASVREVGLHPGGDSDAAGCLLRDPLRKVSSSVRSEDAQESKRGRWRALRAPRESGARRACSGCEGAPRLTRAAATTPRGSRGRSRARSSRGARCGRSPMSLLGPPATG